MEIFYIEGEEIGGACFLVIAKNEDDARERLQKYGICETSFEMTVKKMIEEFGEDGILALDEGISF